MSLVLELRDKKKEKKEAMFKQKGAEGRRELP